jgi:hypothetical protein
MELLSISSTIQNLHKNSKKIKNTHTHRRVEQKLWERRRKKSPYCELDDISSQKTTTSHTQELKNDEKKEKIARNY